MVEDAIEFAKEYDIDGFRVDAVKHIPHAVHHNFQTRIEAELEHRDVGGALSSTLLVKPFRATVDCWHHMSLTPCWMDSLNLEIIGPFSLLLQGLKVHF